MQQYRYETLMRDDAALQIALSGDWVINAQPCPAQAFLQQLNALTGLKRIEISAAGVERWDSRLVSFLVKVENYGRQRHVAVDFAAMPPGVQKLLRLASAVPERFDARQQQRRFGLVERIGRRVLAIAAITLEVITFTGEMSVGLGRLVAGKAHFRRQDLWSIVQECGPHALPIISLISVLVGLIFAFVGAMQLKLFSAEIYVANLVGLGMVREMGAMMTAVIMAGRTGAAFAAELGSMQANEEIDAYKTMGIPPFDFLVLPRVVALALMMPLLCIYADVMGMLGGFVTGMSLFDFTWMEYFEQTKQGIALHDIYAGMIKSVVFGILVAMIGCMQGLQCGRSSAAVGKATTAAVVYGIVGIIVADAIFTVIYDRLGI